MAQMLQLLAILNESHFHAHSSNAILTITGCPVVAGKDGRLCDWFYS